MPHVVISKDSYKRIKLFSEKYNIPMKSVIDWFIFVLIDEDGEPQHHELIEVLDELKPYEIITTKDLAKECNVSTNAIIKSIKKTCKLFSIDYELFIKTTHQGKRFEIPKWLADEIRKEYHI